MARETRIRAPTLEFSHGNAALLPVRWYLLGLIAARLV
jgi:hypothetical protein